MTDMPTLTRLADLTELVDEAARPWVLTGRPVAWLSDELLAEAHDSTRGRRRTPVERPRRWVIAGHGEHRILPVL